MCVQWWVSSRVRETDGGRLAVGPMPPTIVRTCLPDYISVSLEQRASYFLYFPDSIRPPPRRPILLDAFSPAVAAGEGHMVNYTPVMGRAQGPMSPFLRPCRLPLPSGALRKVIFVRQPHMSKHVSHRMRSEVEATGAWARKGRRPPTREGAPPIDAHFS